MNQALFILQKAYNNFPELLTSQDKLSALSGAPCLGEHFHQQFLLLHQYRSNQVIFSGQNEELQSLQGQNQFLPTHWVKLG